MTRKDIALTLVALVVLGGLALYRPAAQPAPQEGILVTLKQYASERYGFVFRYPAKYFVAEREAGNGERYHSVVTLMEDTEENRRFAEGKETEPREGPTAITIDIFQNNLDQLSLEDWVENSGDSNYKLAGSTYGATELSGAPAVAYRWDGLYPAEALAAVHGGNIVMLTVTHITPQDQIVRDFGVVLGTFSWR